MALDGAGCYVMEAKFDFSIPEATVGEFAQKLRELYTHMIFDAVLNSATKRECDEFVKCVDLRPPSECGQPGIRACLIPGMIPNENIIRAKLCP